jgi:CheY-like chemotaxis protein
MIDLKGKTILIVEDEADLRDALATHFELLKATVLTAIDGLQAFELFCKNQIDLILSDVRMPGQGADGMSFLKKIRIQSPDRPIFVFITGYSDFTEQEAIAQGAQGMISKPFGIKELNETMKKFLG